MSIEGTANTEYASLSGKIRTFVVDKTLTISGACADAKATGEAIEKTSGVVAEEYLNEVLPHAVEAAVEELSAALQSDVESKSQAYFDYYVGTGGCGSTNPNTLSFPFIPKVVFIFDNQTTESVISNNPTGWNVLFPTLSIALFVGYTTYSTAINCNINGTTVSWFCAGISGDIYQCNKSGHTYSYFAIG